MKPKAKRITKRTDITKRADRTVTEKIKYNNKSGRLRIKEEEKYPSGRTVKQKAVIKTKKMGGGKTTISRARATSPSGKKSTVVKRRVYKK